VLEIFAQTKKLRTMNFCNYMKIGVFNSNISHVKKYNLECSLSVECLVVGALSIWYTIPLAMHELQNVGSVKILDCDCYQKLK
jgi:hypothetical protein